MSWLSSLFGSVNAAIEKIPSDKEREEVRAIFTKEIMEIESKMEIAIMNEATARYQKDMESGSWLNRHIRAIIMLIYTLLIVVLPFFDIVAPEIFELYTTIAMLVYGFYFGGKSFEKSIELLTLIRRGK
ncbi:MAG: hypothetical protein K2N45_00500 [Helicobacter japonicus]|nr:hypothetical protein [Helicobacter japonicus]